MQFDRVREQRAAVMPGDRDRARPRRVDQPAAQPRQARALLLHVRHDPGDVADRAGSDAVRGGEPVVDRMDLIEFHHDRSPGGEGGRMVEHDVAVPLVADGQDK
jgi:hypothetical protein